MSMDEQLASENGPPADSLDVTPFTPEQLLRVLQLVRDLVLAITKIQAEHR
jgi:hypothetical protein